MVLTPALSRTSTLPWAWNQIYSAFNLYLWGIVLLGIRDTADKKEGERDKKKIFILMELIFEDWNLCPYFPLSISEVQEAKAMTAYSTSHM